MSILSDKTIRKLCAASRDVRPLEAFVEDIHNEYGDPVTGAVWTPDGFDVNAQAYAMFMAQTFGMIYPFEPDAVRCTEARSIRGGELCEDQYKVISYGTSSYGYDVTLSRDIKLFTNVNAAEIDPKRFDEQACLTPAKILRDDSGAEFVRIPPNSYMLGATNEYFRIPRDLMIVCLGKSTYARSGAIVNVTPIEPGFEGNVVLEISNSTPLPMRVYINEGIAQFMFFRGDEPCEVSYADRAGKYQGQTGVTLSKV